MGCLCQKCTILTIFFAESALIIQRKGMRIFAGYIVNRHCWFWAEKAALIIFLKKPRFRYFSCQKATRLHSEPTPWNWRRELKHCAISVMLLFQIPFFAARMVKNIAGNYFSLGLFHFWRSTSLFEKWQYLCPKEGNIFVISLSTQNNLKPPLQPTLSYREWSSTQCKIRTLYF